MNAVRTTRPSFSIAARVGCFRPLALKRRRICGLGSTQPQGGGVFDHLVVSLSDQLTVDGPGEDRFESWVRGCLAEPVEPGRANVFQPWEKPVAE